MHLPLLVRAVMILTALLAAAGTAEAAKWHRTWWDPATAGQLSERDSTRRLAASSLVVIGEDHYNAEVQAAAAAIIAQFSQPLLGWEFLHKVDAEPIAQAFDAFTAGQITAQDLGEKLQPQAPSEANYGPIFEALRAAGGSLLATNLSREQKAPVLRGGLSAVDESIVPAGFALGDEGYFRRFAAAMRHHPLPFPLENYFAAHCLTDDVMASSLLDQLHAGPRILLTGSFHGDYKSGVVQRLQIRMPSLAPLYVRIVDVSSLRGAEVHAMFRDETFGPIADLLFIVGEPLS